MTEHYCHMLTRGEERIPCDKPARWQMGVRWYCAEHYDKVMAFIMVNLRRNRREALQTLAS